ncbi:MAG: geranylgeranylglycerol-phosphate geranylgeranyltransferase [Bacteroidota bacterium]
MPRRVRYILFKIWALLSMVRWINVLVIAIALYLSAMCLLNDGISKWEILKNPKLHLEVIALSLFIMSGYIINAFYDLEKDLINKPKKTYIDRLISRKTSLNAYITFNGIAAILSLFVGWKVFIINLLFSFALWLYSHKLRKKAFMGELGATLLTVAPFVSLSVYYSKITAYIFLYVSFIFLLALTREIIKKLIRFKGDLVVGEKSLPIVIGEQKSKGLAIFFMLGSLAQLGSLYFIQWLLRLPFWFIAMGGSAIFISIILMLSTQSGNNYKIVNWIYKILLVGTVAGIALIY